MIMAKGRTNTVSAKINPGYVLTNPMYWKRTNSGTAKVYWRQHLTYQQQQQHQAC